MRYSVIGFTVLALAGCEAIRLPTSEQEISGEAHSGGVTTEILVRPRARPEGLSPPQDTVSGFEVVSAEEAKAAQQPQSVGGRLGTTIASLGNPAESGLWLKTPLVGSEQKGRVVFSKTGKEVSVTLIPLDGPETAGSQLSLSAMQIIGAPLTDLPTIEVFSEA